MNKIETYYFTDFLFPDEKIEFIIHKHWFALIFPLTKVFTFGVFMPLFVGWIFSGNYMIYISIMWFLAGMLYLIYELVDWYYDAIVLTNMNILDIEWKGIFSRTANRINYDSVESVSYIMKGAFPTILKFGDLKIQTVAEGEKGMNYTAEVREMQKLVLNKRDEVLGGKNKQDTEVLRKAMEAIIQDKLGHLEDKESDIPPQASPLPDRPVIIIETKEIGVRKRKR